MNLRTDREKMENRDWRVCPESSNPQALRILEPYSSKGGDDEKKYTFNPD
jgi:hypothetical protein